MERIGTVESVLGEDLVITFCRPTDCEKCGACHGNQAQVQLTLKGTANVGDQVVVRMPSGNVLKASFLAYTVPLIGLVGGMLLGYMLFANAPDRNLPALLGGFVGLILAMAVIRLTDRVIKRKSAWHPKLIRVIANEQEEK